MVICRICPRAFRVIGIGILISLLAGPTAALASHPTDVDSDTVKGACKGQARKIGLSVGDFGDVRFEEGPRRWTTRLNVRGTGEKFKARCGRHEPRLTDDHTGLGIASRLFDAREVKERCRAEALSSGMESGDFGDAAFEGGSDQWVTTLWVKQSGTKYKARCRWDGFRSPTITRLEAERGHSSHRLSGKDVKRACKRQALQQGLQVGDFGDVDYDARSKRYTTRMNVRSNGRKYKATCHWDGKGEPVVK